MKQCYVTSLWKSKHNTRREDLGLCRFIVIGIVNGEFDKKKYMLLVVFQFVDV